LGYRSAAGSSLILSYGMVPSSRVR
jgi:hypothetical protein